MNWTSYFWDCALNRGIFSGKNPFSQMRLNKSFYECLNKRPTTEYPKGEDQ